MRIRPAAQAARAPAGGGAPAARPTASRALALREYGIYAALALLVLGFSLAAPAFRTQENLFLVLRQVSVNGILAVGMTFVILTAGIDLSVGSLLALAGLASGLLAQRDPTATSVVLALAAPLLVGVAGGALNGSLVAFTRVSPLIVTLGTLTAYRGLAVWYRVDPIYDLQPWYRELGRFELGPLPLPALVFLGVAGAASLALSRTRFGRQVYAVGGNPEAARAAGIPVARVRLCVYLISGLCAGLAALVFTARLGAAQSIAGQGFELQAIAAVVVGGTSLFGGRGRVHHTVVGTLLIGVLFNGLVLLNVPSPIQQMAIGAIIVGAVWLDGALQGREP
jgi:ribose/xylose/arabinose/galactoside ABC-type transport system permease subunit